MNEMNIFLLATCYYSYGRHRITGTLDVHFEIRPVVRFLPVRETEVYLTQLSYAVCGAC